MTHHRPASDSSTRSRRNEVWELKRQRWLEKQGKGGHGAERPRSNSPLSKLVAAGYPPTSGESPFHQGSEAAFSGAQRPGPTQRQGSAYSGSAASHQFSAGGPQQWDASSQQSAGQRPGPMQRQGSAYSVSAASQAVSQAYSASGPQQWDAGSQRSGSQRQPSAYSGSTGSHAFDRSPQQWAPPQQSSYQRSNSAPRPIASAYSSSTAASPAFDAGVAQQWSANVQHGVHQRQERYDPSLPRDVIASGRAPPGGDAKISLSWGTAGEAGAMPPRMPGRPGGNYSSNGSCRTPSSVYSGQSVGQSDYGANVRAAGGDGRRGRGSSPHPGSRVGMPPLPEGDRGAGQRREASYGMDGDRFGSAGSRSNSRGPSSRGCDMAAGMGAAGARGRAAGHTPGGASQIVFG